jgi:hypothetical protein
MGRDWMPGVPAMGHISTGGFWHSGSADGCTKCEPPQTRRPGEQVTVTVLPPCDLHQAYRRGTVPARYDAKTRSGPWAYLCEECYERVGVGLGTGRGQRLLLPGEEVGS